MRLSAIVAMDLDRVIGRENALPWRLPADLKRFRRLTTGKPIVMGRRTHESIGRPLPDRTNLVVSRTLLEPPAGCLLARSLNEALVQARIHLGPGREAMVIGGAELFADALPKLERIYLTVVGAHVGGDVRFPALDPREWAEVGQREELPADAANAHPQRFVTLERVDPGASGSGRPSWLEWTGVGTTVWH